MALSFVFVFILLMFFSFRKFDHLIRYQHTRHHPAWVQDGAPCGYFWRVFRAGSTAHLARTRLAWRWLYHTPPWARASTELLGILWQYRISTVAFYGWLLMGALRGLGRW